MEHSKEFLELAEDARSRVKEISVQGTLEKVKDGANLIDVREDNEFEAGHAKDAVHLGRGVIERDIVGKFPDKDVEFNRQVREGIKRGKESEKYEPRAVAVKHENGRTFVELATGWNFSFDPRVFSELKNASEKDLEQVKIWGKGYTL